MRLTLAHSSTILFSSHLSSILCDPWYSSPIFDGGWLLPSHTLDSSWINLSTKSSPLRYIYVSHLHPDHYDVCTLKDLLLQYQGSRILIADWNLVGQKNHLLNKLRRDGFQESQIISAESIDLDSDTSVETFCWSTGSISDVDSALIVKSQSRRLQVVNLNDCTYNENLLLELRSRLYPTWTTLVLASYSPAGPYPHSYLNTRGPSYRSTCHHFKSRFLSEYAAKCKSLNANYAIPCAGGFRFSNSKFNLTRHYPSYLEALNQYQSLSGWRDYNHSVTFSKDGVYAVSHLEGSPISDYSTTRSCLSFQGLPSFNPSLVRNIEKAYAKACKLVPNELRYLYVLPFKEGFYLSLPIDASGVQLLTGSQVQSLVKNQSIVTHMIVISNTLLSNLLSGTCHWDNAEKGALYLSSRYPDIFDRTAQSWLHFFNIV